MSRALRDPVPVAPFLNWFDHQMHLTRCDRNAWPKVTGDNGSKPNRRTGDRGELTYVLMRIGWSEVAGARRIHRWRHKNVHGLVERAVVEDALWRAGYAFEDVYECAGAEGRSAAAGPVLEVAGPGTTRQEAA